MEPISKYFSVVYLVFHAIVGEIEPEKVAKMDREKITYLIVERRHFLCIYRIYGVWCIRVIVRLRSIQFIKHIGHNELEKQKN